MSRDHQFHEPTTYEAGQWRELAEMARDCATGKRKSWRELQRSAMGVGRCRVFGINNRGNVCNLLIQCALDAAQSVAPSRYFDELHRLSDEVLKRCEAWAEVRKAQVSVVSGTPSGGVSAHVMEGASRFPEARNQRDFFVSEEDEARWRQLEYFTPPWAVRAMVEQMPSVFHNLLLQRVFEPAAGHGHIYEPLRQIGLERGFEVRGQDIYAHAPDKGFAVGDFLFPGVTYPGVNVVVTNPPFKLAADFVQRGLEIAADVIVLCRLSFLNSGQRHDLHFNNSAGNLTTFLPCIERVPMVLGRYDPQASTATEYAWFHYRRGYTGAPVVKPIPPGSRTRHQRPEDVRI